MADFGFIAEIHTHEVSLKLWIGMANLHFLCHRNILGWQKQFKNCRFVGFGYLSAFFLNFQRRESSLV